MKRKTIEQVIKDVYCDYKITRKGDTSRMREAPIEKDYTPGEVGLLIDSIINRVNSHIASAWMSGVEVDE